MILMMEQIQMMMTMMMKQIRMITFDIVNSSADIQKLLDYIQKEKLVAVVCSSFIFALQGI